MKSILENRPALTYAVNQVAEVAGYLWQKGWALPVAMTIQEAEDVDGLGGRVDFIKCKIVLNWNEPDSQRGKKWVIHK